MGKGLMDGRVDTFSGRTPFSSTWRDVVANPDHEFDRRPSGLAMCTVPLSTSVLYSIMYWTFPLWTMAIYLILISFNQIKSGFCHVAVGYWGETCHTWGDGKVENMWNIRYQGHPNSFSGRAVGLMFRKTSPYLYCMYWLPAPMQLDTRD